MTSSVSSASVWPGTLTNILEILPTNVAKYSVIAASLSIRRTRRLVQTVGRTSLTSKMQKVRGHVCVVYLLTIYNRCSANQIPQGEV